ncbi:MAG: DUF1822 family protein [Phormidesmis sp.]
MIHSTKQELAISIPLTLAVHQVAQQFCQQHLEPRKEKQVYLNTLAVEAVRIYLGWLGIASDRQTSDTWNPIMQTLADVADLALPGKGRLECRPVLPGESTCYIPPEANVDSLGYLPVLFDENLETATLLGFVPRTDINVETQQVLLDSLPSLDSLFDLLESKPALHAERVHLGQWLEGTIPDGWRTIEALFGPQPAFNFRNPDSSPNRSLERSLETTRSVTSSVVRGKVLELMQPVDRSNKTRSNKTSLPDERRANKLLPTEAAALSQYAECCVVLIVDIAPGDALQSNIWVKFCPISGHACLPEDLEVRILDDQDIVVMEAQSKQTNMLQLNFRGMLNEQFAIEVALNGVSLVERFII